MANHPNRSRSRLAQYDAKRRTVDGSPVIERVDPNDNARRRFQYRRVADGLQRRVLRHDGSPMSDGSPWQTLTDQEMASMYAIRGAYHPILDPLGL